MFEVGFAELFLLGVIALLVVGPDKLPGLARTVGVWVGKAQRLVGQVRADIEREVRADELRRAAKEYSPTNVLSDMKKEVEDFAGEVSKPIDLDEKPSESAGTPGSGDVEPPKDAVTESAQTGPAPPSETGPAGEEAAAGTESDLPFEVDASRTEPAAAAPDTAPDTGPDTGNGAVAEAAKAPPVEPEAAEPTVAGAAAASPAEPAASDSDPSDGTRPVEPAPAAPQTGEELANGRTESAAPPPTSESAETRPAERDERTAAP